MRSLMTLFWWLVPHPCKRAPYTMMSAGKTWTWCMRCGMRIAPSDETYEGL